MFATVERRLAILNVSVVIAIVALFGLGTWVLLGRSLDREADAALETRIASARETLTDLPSTTPVNQVQPNSSTSNDNSDDEDHEEDDKESRDIIISGDTLVFVFDANGDLVSNRRNVAIDHIPDEDGVEAALEGETDTRFVTVEGERIRVRTEPVYHDGDVVAAIQAVRSETEHDDELALVRTMTLVGTGIGVLIAVPAGIYLTRRAMAPIDDVFQRQRAFVSDAAHELRTPLTVLRANAEVMMRTPVTERVDMDRDLREMISDIDAMSRLVDELLQMSRVDHPDYTVEIRDMDLRPVIDRAVRLMAPLAEDAGVQTRTSGEDLRVRGNPEMVGQVMRIVLDNAIKYTLAGGTIDIIIRREGHTAHIDVHDTGTGISPEDLPHVFDRFYRADKARTRSSGTGLGLSIARGLLTLLGGSISLESVLHKGTTVDISLPLAQDQR